MAERNDESGADQASAPSFPSWGGIDLDHGSNSSEVDLEGDDTDSSDSSSSDSECDSVSMERRLKARGVFEIRYCNKDLVVDLGCKKVKTLGRGLSGDVILARSKENSGREYAIKRFNLDSRDTTSRAMLLVKEVTITSKLNHPHIISDLVPCQCPRYAAIYMRYYPEGSLHDHIQRLKPFQIKQFFVQLGWAVKYMHHKNIIHRDIKLDNILVEGPASIVLADFGLASKITRHQKVEGAVGSTAFMAPEARTFDDHRTPYDGYLADSYSCGVVLWAMLLRTPPTSHSPLLEALRSAPVSDALVPGLRSVALQLLEPDPRARTSVSLLENIPSVKTPKRPSLERESKESDNSSWPCYEN